MLSDRWDKEERKSFDGDVIKKVEVEYIAITGTNVSAHVTLSGWGEMTGDSSVIWPSQHYFLQVESKKRTHSPCKIPFGFL